MDKKKLIHLVSILEDDLTKECEITLKRQKIEIDLLFRHSPDCIMLSSCKFKGCPKVECNGVNDDEEQVDYCEECEISYCVQHMKDHVCKKVSD